MKKAEFEKLQELLEDDNVVSALYDCNDATEFEKILTEKGIVFQDGEAAEIYAVLLEKMENGDELSETDLEDAAGGFAITSTLLGFGAVTVATCIFIKFAAGQLGQKNSKRKKRR